MGGSGMSIGAAAARAGLTPKMIRSYERLSLVPSCPRIAGGYRVFSNADVHLLRFIGRARQFGFPVAAIRELLALWQDHRRPSARVKALAMEHIGAFDAKLAALESLKRALKDLARHCAAEGRPDCPPVDVDPAAAPPHDRRPLPAPRHV
jgi:MerR family copper efflux transcriptional regulator